MKILILGGDGYLGWPTALHFSKQMHEVMVVDNYLRRKMSAEEDCMPLFEVPELPERIYIWNNVSNRNIKFVCGDICDYSFLVNIVKSFHPDVIVHFAEQPSAPYSMKNFATAAMTLNNNLNTTLNVIFAVKSVDIKIHIVKIGTMGEYGTPNIDIEEGWIDIEHNGRAQKFIYPRQASSLYHTTKIMDTDLLWFYVRTWGLKVTDLMQGPVYGIFTEENKNNKQLLPFFNYDELFGTVVNRFIVQAVAGYPLTVYGSGEQVRGYLNIIDTLNCVRISAENPPSLGELRIMNQYTETFSVRNIANMVKKSAEEIGFPVEIRSVPNPRVEAEKHYYNPKFTKLLDLGLTPNFLNNDTLKRLITLVAEYKDCINSEIIFKGVKW